MLTRRCFSTARCLLSPAASPGSSGAPAGRSRDGRSGTSDGSTQTGSESVSSSGNARSVISGSSNEGSSGGRTGGQYNALADIMREWDDLRRTRAPQQYAADRGYVNSRFGGRYSGRDRGNNNSGGSGGSGGGGGRFDDDRSRAGRSQGPPSAAGVPNLRPAELPRYETRLDQPGLVYSPQDLSFDARRPLMAKYRLSLLDDNFKNAGVDPLDEWKSASLLSDFLTDMGRIKTREQTGLGARSQRKLAKAVRRARALGILPSTSKYSFSDALATDLAAGIGGRSRRL